MRWADVELVEATVPVAVDDLTPGELARLPDGIRRHDWLLGRAALKALLGIDDTSSLAFPNRSVSLTHAAGVAALSRRSQGRPMTYYDRIAKKWHAVTGPRGGALKPVVVLGP